VLRESRYVSKNPPLTDGSLPSAEDGGTWRGKGMLKYSAIALLASASVVAGSAESNADETGLAVIHSWVKTKGKTCFRSHNHYGRGSGPTQSQARAEAIKSWIWLTSLEYGNSWASYRLAAGKGMECARNGAVWSCDTQARPCRKD